MIIVVEGFWKIPLSLIRLGLKDGLVMSKQILSLFLVALLVVPLLHSVKADEAMWTNLEAKNLTATFDAENETTTLSWGNINTNDFLILDELKTTNYSLYRSDEPLNSSNYLNAELIENNVQACLPTDTYAECKERTHSVTKSIPPSTNGSFYYGVVSTLQNGTIISNFTENNAALGQPIQEYGSPITSPYALQATYDAMNATTTLLWIDISTVDASMSGTHTTTIWSHEIAATSSNWDTLEKSEVVANLSSDITHYDIVHQQPVSRTLFYTVMHSFNDEVDTRLLSGNTLIQGIEEDNVGSSIEGTLIASFDASTSQTSLDWNGSVVEDANHTLHIWRSPSQIVDLASEHVTEVAQLSASDSAYNYTVESSYSGLTYYMVTLSDQFGNQQTNLGTAPNAVLFEYTLIPEENIIDDLSVQFADGRTQLTWTDIPNHPEAQYQIWRSSVDRINSNDLSGPDVELLAIVDAGQEHYNNSIAADTSEDAWYAVTVIASFGTQDVTYAQTNITLSYNSLMLPVTEDTLAPTAPAALEASYFANGTTELRWAGQANEDGTEWMLYRNLNNDLTEESSWVFIGQMLNQGASLHMMYVETTAEEGGLVNPVYAIGGVDAYGNSIDFSDWEQSSPVREDRQDPQVQLKLYDSSQSLETSRWFTGGESSTFSNLEPDNYSMKFTFSSDVVSLTYSTSTQSESQVVDVSSLSSSIDVALLEGIENITFTFTATDGSGNTMTFDALFCTTCLIEPQIIIEPVETKDEGEDKKADDSSSNEPLLFGAIGILGLLVLVLLLRRPPSKKPVQGLPTAEEDQWFSNYVNE